MYEVMRKKLRFVLIIIIQKKWKRFLIFLKSWISITKNITAVMSAPKTMNNPIEWMLAIKTNKKMSAMERSILSSGVCSFFVREKSAIRYSGSMNINRELYLIIP